MTDGVPAFHGARSLRITVQPGDNRMTGRNGNTTERFEFTLQQTQVMVRTRPAHDASGELDLYLDGEPVGRYRGVMGYVCHGRGSIDTQPRFGLYRDAHPDAGPATLYYDAIRFAATREGLQLPRGNVTY